MQNDWIHDVTISPLAALRKVPTESLEVVVASADAQSNKLTVAAQLRIDFIKAELECRAVVDALNMRIAQYRGRLLS